MPAEQFFKNFVTEWKENTRVQVGSIIILSLLGISLVMLSREISLEKKNLLMGERAKLADVLAIESEDFWEGKNSSQAQELALLRTLIWSAQSDSKLMVTVQSRLLQICDNVGITRPQMKIGEPQDFIEADGYKKVNVALEGFFRNGDFLKLLSLMESGNEKFVFEKLLIATSPNPGKQGRLELVSSVYYQLAEPTK